MFGSGSSLKDGAQRKTKRILKAFFWLGGGGGGNKLIFFFFFNILSEVQIEKKMKHCCKFSIFDSYYIRLHFKK